LINQCELLRLLVSLGGVLERGKNVWVRTSLDAVDKAGNFGEERIIVGVGVTLLVIVSWTTDVESGRLVWVDQTHVVSIGPNLKLTGVSVALKGDRMGE